MVDKRVEDAAPLELRTELATLAVQLKAQLHQGGFALMPPLELSDGQLLPAEVVASIVLSDLDDCVASADESAKTPNFRWEKILGQMQMLVRILAGQPANAALVNPLEVRYRN